MWGLAPKNTTGMNLTNGLNQYKCACVTGRLV